MKWWRHHGRGNHRRSAESVDEFIARRSDLSPADVQQRSAERFPTFATSLTPTGSPANVRSSLTIWYRTHASIGWTGCHTSDSPWQRGDDRRQVLRARSPNSPIDAAPSRKKQLRPNIHTIQHREAVPGPCLFHPRCMSMPPRRVAATASRRSKLLPPVYMGETWLHWLEAAEVNPPHHVEQLNPRP
jgi:hypothetical protein